MILEYLERGAAVGAWVIGFVCVLALAVCVVAFIVALFEIAFTKDEADGEEEVEGAPVDPYEAGDGMDL